MVSSGGVGCIGFGLAWLGWAGFRFGRRAGEVGNITFVSSVGLSQFLKRFNDTHFGKSDHMFEHV